MPCRWILLSLPMLALLAGCAAPVHQPPPDVEVTPPVRHVAVKPAIPPAPKIELLTNSAPAGTPSQPLPPVHRAETIPPTLGETWVRLDEWAQYNGFGDPRRVAVENGIVYAVTAPLGTLMVRMDSTIATWRGIQLYLGFSPKLINGHLLVHTLDLSKNFLPLMTPTTVKSSHHVIVIDPGHGGSDPGTRNIFNGNTEKEFTLDLARRLESRLAIDGWNVWLTRTNDIALPLPARVSFADEHHADIFLSLHFNSLVNNLHEAGLETYCLTPQGMPSNLTRDYEDNPMLVFPNNQFDADNLRLAVSLHRAILKVNGRLDRGVRHARFLGVLKGQTRPAVLIEAGYLSDPAEARRIADPAYRQRLAEAIASALKFETNSVPDIAAKSTASINGTSNSVTR